MTRYAKRKLIYSVNEKYNLLPYVEWDRFVTLTGAQAELGLRYRIYPYTCTCSPIYSGLGNLVATLCHLKIITIDYDVTYYYRYK